MTALLVISALALFGLLCRWTLSEGPYRDPSDRSFRDLDR